MSRPPSRCLARFLARSAGLGAVLCASLAATACRGGDDAAGDDTPDIDASVDTDDVSIYDIQQGVAALGTPINVRGVVVTAIDNYGGRKGNIWVAEPDGGAYSGVLVYGVEVSDVADLVVGDLIDLENVVIEEFALTEDTSGRTTTELTPPDGGAITVTKVGDGTVPAPAVVDALAIGQLTTQDARDAEWEKWEGVLIRLENVSRLTGLRSIDQDDPTFVEFQVTGPMRIDSSLAEITETTIGEIDNCFASITGIGDYFFNYKLLPRATADITSGGTGCPAQESTTEACADTVDNDADGFTDCDDNSCRVLAECQTDTTVTAIQMGTVTGTVVLDDVVVTAVSYDRKHLWVADSLTSAPHNGVYVFRGGSATELPAEVVIGATVDVTGTVLEYNNDGNGSSLTEITQVSALTFVAAPAGTPTPVTGVSVADLMAEATGEPYEGVFVEIGPLRVSAAPDNFGVATLTDGTTTTYADDTAYRPAQSPFAIGDCVATLRGIWSYNVFTNSYVIEPVGASAIVEDPGACTGF